MIIPIKKITVKMNNFGKGVFEPSKGFANNLYGMAGVLNIGPGKGASFFSNIVPG